MEEQNIIRRIVHHRNIERPQFLKIIIPRALATHRETVLSEGCHILLKNHLPLASIVSPILMLAHFPVRTEKQLRQKIINGWESRIKNPTNKPGQSFQWKQLYDRCKDPTPITHKELQDIALTYAVPNRKMYNDIRYNQRTCSFHNSIIDVPMELLHSSDRISILSFYMDFPNSRTMACALIDRKHKLIMGWSAKAGCTICIKMFFEHMGILQEALEYNPWVHRYREDIFNKTNVVTESDFHDSSYFKFKVVRNPYDRAVSSYLTIMNHINVEKDKRYQRERCRILDVLQLDTSDISFSQFIDYLTKINISQCNLHYALQKKEYETNETFNKICKLERINKEVERINKLTGANFVIADKTSSHHVHKNTNIARNVSYEPWSHIKDTVPSYKYFFNPNMIENVFRIYNEDIETYQYSFNDLL